MKSFLIVLFALLPAWAALGQDSAQPELPLHSWDVFTRQNAENATHTDVIFIDLLSGDQSTISATGERFALANTGVIFFDTVERQVKLGKADGVIRDHPFINLTDEASRVDWAVSDDKDWIVWSISRELEDGRLITATWLADVAGTEIRELLVYGPRDGIQLRPIGFGGDESEIFMEAMALGGEGSGIYARRTGLFALALADDELVTRALPGDQTCFCAVGFGANLMLRLAPNRAANGLDVEIFALNTGEKQVIAALSRGNYSEGGNILISADGKQAVYALSQIRETAAERGEIQSVLVYVDIENGRQRIASSPIASPIRPLRFSERNRAALVAAEQIGETLKVEFEDGRLVTVADAIYLGQIGQH
ncbi:MAG: hypothetical protein OXG53_09305 [Chloroflexi bacterium]|nr:hypothetical protein [Chloroflexota bacterium]